MPSERHHFIIGVRRQSEERRGRCHGCAAEPDERG